jgi:hypothetical protein
MRILGTSFYIVVCALALAGSAHAQSNAPISFDLLQSARAADSLRAVAARQKGEIARLNKTVAVLTAQQQYLAEALESNKQRHVDTVRIVDTLKVPAASPAPSKPSQVEPPQSKLPSSTPPAAVTFGLPQFSGLLQLWAFGGDAAYRSTVRVRRAEVKLVSDLGRRARATLVFDVAKSLSLATGGSGQVSVSQNSRELQDGFISLPLGRVLIDAGQLKIPLGLEGTQSSSALESAERALMFSDRARGGTFGDIRDLGFIARGTTRWAELHAGVFNGSGETQNDVDRNVSKSLIGRFVIKTTGIRGLQLGVSGATSGNATVDKPTRDRVGGEVLYRRGALLVQSEGMQGQDGITTRRGGYLLMAWPVRPGVRVHARADAWDPDVHAESTAPASTERDFALGTTWTPSASRLKLQLVGVRKTYTSNIVPAATQAIITMQAAW